MLCCRAPRIFPSPKLTPGPLLTIAVLCLTLIAGVARGAPEPIVPPEWQARWADISALGEGFVVWESNRTGAWRIWYRRLDGSVLRQLSPDEPGREHYCPHLSPNGQYLAYLSYPKGTDTYKKIPKPHAVPLMLLEIASGKVRQLTPSARAYYEDRAVVWLDDHALIYIDGAGATRQFSLDQSEPGTVLVPPGKAEHGVLLNRQLQNGTNGRPWFGPYDSKTSLVAERQPFNGCQPYFSHDGRWGFWMGAAGGPVMRVDLATRATAPILNKHDARMPTDRGYLYFPMVSRCGRLLAVGASPNQHDHFKSDYDIFVLAIDPATLLPTGPLATHLTLGVTVSPMCTWMSWPLGKCAAKPHSPPPCACQRVCPRVTGSGRPVI
jgi:hypothetical protein